MSDFASGCMFIIFFLLVIAAPVIAVLIARPKKRLYKIIFRETGMYAHKSTIVEAKDVGAAIRKLHRRVSYVAEIYSIEEYTLGHG